MARSLLVALIMGLSSCAQSTITPHLPQDRAMEAKPAGKDLGIMQAWNGDYPVAELGRLPVDQVKERVGYIGDKATFTAVWQAMKPSLALPEVDFTVNVVVFSRNTAFYNRTSIARVVLKNGIVEVIAIETMSSLPIEDKVAMALAVIPRIGVQFIQTDSGLIPVMKASSTAPMDASYRIEGRNVLLYHGRAEEETIPGSMMKSTVAVFGRPVFGDLDGDGDDDAGLILVHNPGGSGTFFSVAAALNRNGMYQGTNAVLLGDRIAPHDLDIRNGVIVVNFAERGPTEPMTAPPTVGRTKYLKVKALTLAAIEPLGKGEQVVEGWVTIGHEVRSFLPCAQKKSLWLAGSSPALKDILSAYGTALPNPKPYTALFMILAGTCIQKPTNGLASSYETAFCATQLVQVWPQGKCR